MTRSNRNYVDYVLKDHIYAVDNSDLGINVPGVHDVIVIGINKRSKKCQVKTITSLEQYRQNNWRFKNYKLDAVRNGNLLVIPQKEMNTKHLSGIDHRLISVKVNKVFFSNSNYKFPRRYKNLIHKK